MVADYHEYTVGSGASRIPVTEVFPHRHKQRLIAQLRADAPLTAAVLLLSVLQSGMIFDSWTIQLLILSLLLLSTARQRDL